MGSCIIFSFHGCINLTYREFYNLLNLKVFIEAWDLVSDISIGAKPLSSGFMAKEAYAGQGDGNKPLYAEATNKISIIIMTNEEN